MDIEMLQIEVKSWLVTCFGEQIAQNKLERNDRFIEESLELVQSLGYTKERVLALVDYVFDRPVGQPIQEVGGVLITLAALCYPNKINLDSAAHQELHRITEPYTMNKIREKQANKPTGSALPQ